MEVGLNLKIKILFLLVAMAVPAVSWSEPAQTCPSPEFNRAQFWVGPVNVTDQAQAIGTDDLCDGFGGFKIKTPKWEIEVYVNATIQNPLPIDLEMIDRTYEEHALENFKESVNMTISFVTSQWLARIYGEDYRDNPYVLSMRGFKIMFVNETTMDPVSLQKSLQEVYSIMND